MRMALIADGHALGAPLDQLLEHLIHQGIEHFIFLGDQLGYGPDPVYFYQKIFWLQSQNYQVHIIAGNHEKMLLDIWDVEYHPGIDIGFSTAATGAIFWTRDQIKQHDEGETIKNYINALPSIIDIPNTSLVGVHASMLEPYDQQYLLNRKQYKSHIKRFKQKFPGKHIIAHGHTHLTALVKGMRNEKGQWTVQNRGSYKHWVQHNPTTHIHQKSETTCLSINPGRLFARNTGKGLMSCAILDEDEDKIQIDWLWLAYDTERMKLHIKNKMSGDLQSNGTHYLDLDNMIINKLLCCD